jgi:hypothetical protein
LSFATTRSAVGSDIKKSLQEVSESPDTAAIGVTSE